MKTATKWIVTGMLSAVLSVTCISYIADNYAIRILLVLILAALAGGALARFIYAFKINRSTGRKIWLGIRVGIATGLVVLAVLWKTVSDDGGQVRQEPFCIAGNLYYVGTKDVTSFLLTGSQGHVLIDGGYPGTAKLIEKNIALLGFKITDVKILLNSHAHLDHAGGLAELQKASGAELWVSEPEAEMLRNGGAGSRNLAAMNLLVYLGMAKFPSPHIDRLFNDGATITLGTTQLTAHITPGHTPGCTTWTFPVRQGRQILNVTSIGSLTLLPGAMFGERYDKQLQTEFKKSFKTLRSLPCDIFIGSHAGFFKMDEKLKKREAAPRAANPFIDTGGYLEYIANAEKKFDKVISDQEAKRH